MMVTLSVASLSASPLLSIFESSNNLGGSMLRVLKVSTLLGVGFVAGVLGMCRILKDGAITISEDGDVRVKTTPMEYLKTVKNIGRDEER